LTAINILMSKKDKLKCYTRTANDGHKYVSCDDKSKVKPKKKNPKDVATDAMNAIKKVKNMSGNVKLKKQFIERVNAVIDENPTPNTTAKPKPKPANYDMLRPEIRKKIYSYSGNPKKVIEEKILAINLNKDIKTRVINSVLNDLSKGSLSELNINTTVPMYNENMRRKMKTLGKGFAVSNSAALRIEYILDDVGEALGIDDYMTFLSKVEERLEGVVKQRKQRQAKERAEAVKIRKERKEQEKSEKGAVGDDDEREFYTTQSIRDYLKWDKVFAKRVTAIAKSGLENEYVRNRFDNSLVKVKNFVISELKGSIFPSRGSYNEVKERIAKNKFRLNNPAWNMYNLFK